MCFATFSGDLAPALMTLGAEVDIVRPGGKRTLPLQQLYIGHARHDGSAEGDGKHYLALQPGELVAAVRAKRTPGLRSAYDKIRIRRSIEYPVAGVAVALRREGDDARRPARRHNRHQSAPRAARGHRQAVRRQARRRASSRASTASCATRSCR